MEQEACTVLLNIYDLSQGLAKQVSSALLGKTIDGVWHTGIVVYGNEYYYGGGIQTAIGCKMPYGSPVKSMELGATHIPKDVFESFLEEISPRYTADAYRLLSHNCNSFSNEAARFLVGVGIPEYILKLPNEVMSSPMAPLLLPMIRSLEAMVRAGGVSRAPLFEPAAETTPSDGAARGKVQEEIAREFSGMMGAGSVGVSEAAVIATRKVMQKCNHVNVAR